jgi:hypothetical protein
LVDPSAAGKKGAQASLLTKRLASQRRLEERIEGGKNGQAQAFLLRVRMRREAELEQLRIYADKELVAIEEWTITAREELEETLAELERARSEREAQLEQALVDEPTLTHLLANCDQAMLERVLISMGFENDDDPPRDGVAS